MYKLYQDIKGKCECFFDAHSNEIYVYDNFNEINEDIKGYHVYQEYLPIKAGKGYTYGSRLIVREYTEAEKSLRRLRESGAATSRPIN